MKNRSMTIWVLLLLLITTVAEATMISEATKDSPTWIYKFDPEVLDEDGAFVTTVLPHWPGAATIKHLAISKMDGTLYGLTNYTET